MADQIKIFYDNSGRAYHIKASGICNACRHTAAEHPVADHYGAGKPCPGCFSDCDIVVRPARVVRPAA